MSAIAGIWSAEGQRPALAACRDLIEAQRAYGPDDEAVAGDSGYAAGRALFRMLPEDRFDRQPVESEDGRYLLVADLRLDNREELLAELGVGSGGAADMADSALLLRAWTVWGRDVLDHVLGDFAFAVWDRREKKLFLARDTAGERPLHYFEGRGIFAFASLAPALAEVAGRDWGVDDERLAQFVADLPPLGEASFFKGVKRVEPGHCVEFSPPGPPRRRRYWDPRRAEISFPRAEQYGEALREQLDRAVRRRLRRARGGVGAHLSAGLDSSAVATSAALALAPGGETLFAFTAAPREGFAGPVPAGKLADESGIAGETAALHPNIVHRVLRDPSLAPLAKLGSAHRLAGQPVGHVCNNGWWHAINGAAQAEGVRVLLTGEAGNFTLSAGLGLDGLADLVRLGRWGSWFSEARGLARREFRWRSLLNASFAPWLPERVYERLRGMQPEAPEFLAPAWAAEMKRQLGSAGWEIRPASNSRDRRWMLMQMADPGNFRKRSLAEWGIEERDPTADRRFSEFCFSLPPEALLKDGARRPALRTALKGRVPEAVLSPGLRGYQMPDWYEQIRGEDVLALARKLKPAAPGLIDMAAIERAAASWPTEDCASRPLIYRYRSKLLRALSAAHFARSYRGAHG